MEKFARLFELDNNKQVLLVENYDDEECVHKVVVSTHTEVGRMEATFRFLEKQEAEACINNYTHEMALAYSNTMNDIFQ